MRQRESAFTLIELLVVIGIIAVLIGFLFPVVQSALDRAKKVQAKNDVTQIVTAVNAYYTEYGTYPLDSTKQGYDTLLGDPNGSYDNAFVFNILRAIPDANWNASNTLNSRQVVFFQGSNAKDATSPRSGFASQNTTSQNKSPIKTGGFVDPWGNEYLVGIDGDYDGWTQDFIPYTDLTYTPRGGPNGTRPAVSVGSFAESYGKDGQQGKNGDQKYRGSDDVLSWQ